MTGRSRREADLQEIIAGLPPVAEAGDVEGESEGCSGSEGTKGGAKGLESAASAAKSLDSTGSANKQPEP